MRAIAVVLFALAAALPATHTPAHAGRVVVVHGRVTQSGSGRPIQQALVALASHPGTAAVTDDQGLYRLTISAASRGDQVTIIVRRLGFQQKSRTLTFASDTTVVDFVLEPAALQLSEVLVTGSTPGVMTATMGYSATTVAGIPRYDPRFNTEEYTHIEENGFLSVASSPRSTFSVDVDRASYSNVRRFIGERQLPPKDAVRIEELINYFPYTYPDPRDGTPVSVTTDVADAPWSPTHRVVRIGLQAPRIGVERLPPNNLVFLIDVSGSMQDENKLPLVKQAFRMLVDQLREQDRVAIVVYAGQAGLVLPSTPGSEKQRILDAIDRLEAGGSTAGGAGIRLAYDVAKSSFIRGGNNRVVLATDGDFNVGVSSTSELVRLIEERRAEGTFLTVLGFGMGNLKDGRMEQLADKGNGNYAYIESPLEARKTLVHEMGGTLLTVAKDVKLQIEFNPARVQAYRLIGYENRLLRNEDFTDDRKDAGDMGAGHSVTALYEIIPVGVPLDVKVGTTPPLRYQRPAAPSRRSDGGELLFVNVRYKNPSDTVSRLLQHAVRDERRTPAEDFRFALAVAGYGMLLRDSEHRGNLTFAAVAEMADAARGADPNQYRAEFVKLVRATESVKRSTVSAR